MSLPAKPHPNVLASSRTLVVGGTSGLGAAVVSAALSNGGLVHVASSNQSKIDAKLAEFRALYPSCTVSGSAASMSDASTIEANAERVLQDAVAALGGPLDHIVYTAGDALARPPLAGINAADYFQAWHVRYLGPLIFAKHVAANPGKYLAVGAASSITLTSGILSRKPRPGSAASIPISGATETLARALAVELAPVRVNVVVPGAVQTELLATFPEEVVKAFAQSTLTKSIGRPENVAEAYLNCMRSEFMTGQDIIVDGGMIYS